MPFRFSKFKWRIQFSLLTLFGVMTAVAVCLGISPIIQTQLAVRKICNDDVEVDGGFLGLMVKMKSPASEQLLHLGPQANWALERALVNPEKFAAAHVLLTEINQKQYGEFNASHWNEMNIDLYANGKIDFHPEQIPKLQEFWRNRLGKDRSAAEEGQASFAAESPAR